ncbi:MAG TPA: hypothetical protein VFZ52_03785 [Chryseolinea sp.]
METRYLVQTSILTLALVIATIVSLEMYWRVRGFTPTYNDDKVLWSTTRKQVYKPADEATVFIGGSRIKFDLDVPTWEKLTGEKAIQLAIVGTPGRLILRDLANDKNFKGKLIIDVAEAQFFSFPDSARRDRLAREALAYHYDETPAQKASAYINYFLESRLVFLEEGKYGLTSLLNDLKLTNRPGVNVSPGVFTPKEFGVVDFNRQTSITPMFLANPKLQQRQKEFWTRGIKMASPIKGDTLHIFLEQTKKAIEKIRARGGTIVFVRPPSDGPYIEMENRLYPRQKYWDYLLEYTNIPGIHYADYPGTANLICAEWSHLSRQDAAIYTSQLVKILEEEKGWTFPKKSKSTTQIINR